MYHCIGFGEGQNQVQSFLIIRGDKNLKKGHIINSIQIMVNLRSQKGIEMENFSVKVIVRHSTYKRFHKMNSFENV